MYYFMAHYTNVFTCEETTKNIHFDGQFFPNERAIYIHAMEIAYDLCEKDHVLDGVEFIAC